jgi:hypothetical protein
MAVLAESYSSLLFHGIMVAEPQFGSFSQEVNLPTKLRHAVMCKLQNPSFTFTVFIDWRKHFVYSSSSFRGLAVHC